MRERGKGKQPLKVLHPNRHNDTSKNDYDDKSSKFNGRRKPARKIIRAGSLVRKNINVANKGRNNLPNQDSDFSNSFIEGKSFNTSHNKKQNVIEKPLGNEMVKNSNNTDLQEGISQNKVHNSTNSLGAKPTFNVSFQKQSQSSVNMDPTVTMKAVEKEPSDLDK